MDFHHGIHVNKDQPFVGHIRLVAWAVLSICCHMELKLCVTQIQRDLVVVDLEFAATQTQIAIAALKNAEIIEF